MALSRLRQGYEQIVLKHSESIGLIESALRAWLFISPGRFRDSHINMEMAYTGINLLTMYHDLILLKDAQQQFLKGHRTKGPPPPTFPPGALPIAAALTVLHHVGLLVELYTYKKWQRRGKWTAVFLLEVCKALLRLVLLFLYKGGIIVQQTVPPRSHTLSADTPPDESASSNGVLSKRKKLRLERRMHYEKARKQQQAGTAEHSPLPPTPRRIVGEVLYIVRPLVYLLALFRYGRPSWRPWLLSLAVDVGSRVATGDVSNATGAEQDEISRRTLLWVYYLLRSPFFETVAAKVTEKATATSEVARSSGWKSLLGGPILDYLTAYREHYFYTSAS